jgi:hypothetical protein
VNHKPMPPGTYPATASSATQESNGSISAMIFSRHGTTFAGTS